MKKNSLIALSLICAVVGALLYALHQEWIIIRSTPTADHVALQEQAQTAIAKKKVTLYFWRNAAWHHETIELIWSDNKAENLQYLINSWLTLLNEEALMTKKVSLQAVLLGSQDMAYVSFDRYPFSKEATLHNKWLLIEGLLKTIRENGIKITGVHFLVNHKPLIDPHLDFSKEWPLSGFSDQ
ncbi:MAG: hypothetical protein NTX86_05295 [Candidatus Dependentiae bacterium]|nr:hypothetical protein [Candidatus Dependentiae bacterium]